MSNSFILFFLFFAFIIPFITFFIVIKKVHQYKFLVHWGPIFLFISIIVGISSPIIITRFYILTNYGTQEIFAAKEIQEVKEEEKITQLLVYENEHKINLTEKTGYYYTKIPNSKLYVEKVTFLWFVEWNETYITGLDFIKRN